MGTIRRSTKTKIIYTKDIIMNKWDKVEKNKRAVTEHDIQMIYFKTALFVLAAAAYFYFIIMGWTL